MTDIFYIEGHTIRRTEYTRDRALDSRFHTSRTEALRELQKRLQKKKAEIDETLEKISDELCRGELLSQSPPEPCVEARLDARPGGTSI